MALTPAIPSALSRQHGWLGPRHRWRTTRLLALLDDIPSLDVVEIGAGPGTISRALARRGHRVAATDRALDGVGPRPIKGHMDALNSAAGSPVWGLAEAARQPFRSASADLVVMSEVLEHLPDDHGALVEAARLLRPAGRLLMSVPAGADRFGTTDRLVGHQRRYGREALLALLESSGFADIRIEGWGGPMVRAYDALVLAFATQLAAGASGRSCRPSRRSVMAQRRESAVRRAAEVAFGAASAMATTWFAIDARCPPGPTPAGWLVIARRR